MSVLYPEPRELNTAAELRANAKAVRDYFKMLPAYVAPEPPPPPPPPPPEPEPQPDPLCAAADAAPDAPSQIDPLALPPAWRPRRAIRIRAMVAAHYGFTLAEITSHNRSSHYLLPRYTAIYLCVRHAGLSTPATGRLFGDRDHSTIVHSVRKAKERLAMDEKYVADIAEFVRQIEGWAATESGGT